MKRLLVVGLVAALLPGVPYSRAASCATTHSGWTQVASPFDKPEVVSYPPNNGRSFEAAPYSTVSGRWFTDYVVDPDLPSRVLATDGVRILRSTDGGCTWTAVFSIAEADVTPTTVTFGWNILDLHAERSGSVARQAFWALLTPSGTSLSVGVDSAPATTDVAVSADGGATWTRRSSGVSCAQARLAVAPYHVTTAYLDCWNGEGAESLLATTDLGAHWTKRTPKGFSTPWARYALAVSPVNPNEVWAAGMGYGPQQYKQYWTVVRSTDAGRSVQLVLQQNADSSFYELGLSLAIGRGHRTAAIAWNANVVLEYVAPRQWRKHVVPTPTGQAGAIEYVAYSPDASRLLLVAGYDVGGGTEVYYSGPFCEERQRALVLDLRRNTWRFLPPPTVAPAHVGSAVFHLEAVPVAGGTDYYARESGYRDGNCRYEGGVVTGLRDAYLLRYRDVW